MGECPGSGRYDELADDPERKDERALAHQVLQGDVIRREPACAVRSAPAHRDPAEIFAPIFYRVTIDRVTGHQATPGPRDMAPASVPTPSGRQPSWLRMAVAHVCGVCSSAPG